MVQALYIRTFFSVMPRRMNEIRKLREEKAKYDDFILRRLRDKNFKGEIMSPENLITLADIFGKDGFFRRAERRNKPTLRRYISKTLKSIKIFQNRLKYIIEDKLYANAAKDMMFNDILLPSLDRLILALDSLDKVYISSSIVLTDIANGKRQWPEYAQLIKEENDILDEVQTPLGYVLEFFTNLKKAYARAVKTNPGKTLFLMVAASLALFGCASILLVNMANLKTSEGMFLAFSATLASLITLQGAYDIAWDKFLRKLSI